MRRCLVAILVALVAAIAAAGGALPNAAFGQPSETVGIRIVDAPTNRADDPRARLYIVDHLAPGTTITRRVEVSNDSTKAQSVQLYAASADVVDTAFRFGDGRTANELTRWTTIAPTSLSLAAGAKSFATVTVVVPAKASAGEQYGVVWAEVSAPPPPGGGIGATNRVGVRMYLSVGPGGEPASDFEVTGLQGQRAADGSPVVVATVRNTGARALDLGGELRLSNGPGGLSAGPISASGGSTLGLGQTGPVSITLDKTLPNGPWDAKILMRSGTTSRETSASITFPERAANDSTPVKTASEGSGVIVVAGVGVGIIVLAVMFLVVAKGRRKTDDEPT